MSRIVPITEEHIEGFRAVLDSVARERPTRAHTGVLGIGVLAEFRGRGIGTALIRETLKEARASGLTRIELSVREGNASVLGFMNDSDSCMKECNARRSAWTGNMRISSAWRCFSNNFGAWHVPQHQNAV
jgi:GNAT superfamily N-acetyltransferase